MIQTDRLSRSNLVDQLTRELANANTISPPSQTIGLVGPWGSGKTWVLDEVRPFLSGITRDFNPWLFSDEIGMFRGFASLILERIKDKHARKRIATVLDHVGPSLKGLGFDISGSVAAASKTLKGMASPKAIRDSIAKAMSAEEPTCYVIIDDLDRLTPDELLTMFKLLRLIGDLPGLVYILAYDEETLLRLMMRTEITFGSMERARTYLDKVVEKKIVVPPISDATKSSLVLEPIIKFGREFQRHFDDKAVETLAWKIESLLFSRLATIRLCDRYVAAVTALPPQLFGELSYLDWVLISFLRTVEPHVFHTIQSHPSVFLGRSSLWGMGKEKSVEVAKRVEKELTEESRSESHATDILELVDELFPQFAAHRAERETQGSDSDQGIDNAEYFPLYFEPGLPDGAVSDVAVEKALQALSDVSPTNSDPGGLRDLVHSDPHGVIKGIWRRWTRVTSAKAVFTFLEHLWTSPDLEYQTGLFNHSGKSEVRILATELLRFFTEEELNEVEGRLRAATSADSLVVQTVAALQSPSGSMYFVQWAEMARKTLADVAAAYLLQTQSVDSESVDVSDFIWILRRLDRERVRIVIKELLHSGAIEPREALAWVLRYQTEFGNKIVGVGVDADIRTDSSVVELLRAPREREIPQAWLETDAFLAAINSDDRPSAQLVADYILDDWDARATLKDVELGD